MAVWCALIEAGSANVFLIEVLIIYCFCLLSPQFAFHPFHKTPTAFRAVNFVHVLHVMGEASSMANLLLRGDLARYRAEAAGLGCPQLGFLRAGGAYTVTRTHPLTHSFTHSLTHLPTH